jgi:HTH-type transcriptional regulator/antitoxin HigA
MDIRTIHNKKEYKAALDEIEQLWSAPAKSPEAERLDVLTLLVAHYEKTHFPMADPDPIALIEHVMESRGLTRKDLEPMIGPRGRVAGHGQRTRAALRGTGPPRAPTPSHRQLPAHPC